MMKVYNDLTNIYNNVASLVGGSSVSGSYQSFDDVIKRLHLQSEKEDGSFVIDGETRIVFSEVQDISSAFSFDPKEKLTQIEKLVKNFLNELSFILPHVTQIENIPHLKIMYERMLQQLEKHKPDSSERYLEIINDSITWLNFGMERFCYCSKDIISQNKQHLDLSPEERKLIIKYKMKIPNPFKTYQENYEEIKRKDFKNERPLFTHEENAYNKNQIEDYLNNSFY